ncbi:MAG: DNA repair exonuclease [Candidatus Omnitrophica bacterium]|nr:DNA repair exonuclease [Candidatus Omnitrophota bacterium]MBU1810292.1 DNA repair exonuclease [Candidatus Omnitrophota bacterium]
MIRFLHTGDWQLGMTRHFFSEGVQERFSQSRFDAIRELGRIAKKEDCQFMVVCGDVFESNLVDRKTVSRALEALKEVPVPVYLLPGNHDPLNAASVFCSTTFMDRKPAHVHVIEDTTPIRVVKGTEIVGIPWMSKRPLQDLVALTTGKLEPIGDTLRVCVAHGMMDNLSPNTDDPALISLQAAENALSQNKIHYLALGDRHSLTKVGDSGRIWYAGTPESTDYSEVRSGFALVSTINDEGVTTKEVNVGRWKFIEREQVDLNTKEDIETLRKWLENLEDKERTVIKLRIVGALSLSLYSEFEELIFHIKEVLAAAETRVNNLIVIPEDADFINLGFSGFASCAVERLRSNVEGSGPDPIASRDALSLLVRLTGRER